MALTANGLTGPAACEAGTYQGMLADVYDVQIPVWNTDGEKTNETKPGWRFVYKIETPTKLVELSKDITKTTGPKGNLYKDLRGMLGARFKPELLTDAEKLVAVIKWLIGKVFVVTVELKASGYAKITSVSQLPQNFIPSTAAAKEVVTGFEGMPDKAGPNGMPDKKSEKSLTGADPVSKAMGSDEQPF